MVPMSWLTRWTATRMVLSVRAARTFSGSDAADGIDRHLGHLEAVLGQVLDRVHDRGVLDGGDDEVVALAVVGVGEALDGEVGRLGAAGGEDEVLLALGVDHGGELLAGFLKTLAHLEAVAVEAGGRAVGLAEVGDHGLERILQHGGGGLVIEVDETLVHERECTGGTAGPPPLF